MVPWSGWRGAWCGVVHSNVCIKHLSGRLHESGRNQSNCANREQEPSRRDMASSDEESGDSAVTLDIVRQVGEDEGTVELAKKDLTSIFNKINQSLSDLSALDLLPAGDCDDVATKSGIILKEKSDASFQVNFDQECEGEGSAGGRGSSRRHIRRVSHNMLCSVHVRTKTDTTTTNH